MRLTDSEIIDQTDHCLDEIINYGDFDNYIYEHDSVWKSIRYFKHHPNTDFAAKVETQNIIGKASAYMIAPNHPTKPTHWVLFQKNN